ncbi:DEAD-domain-containing protein [Coccomyxa subellipsoidea C-169]|uniref:DEAD-domain-containing protein n=1 Tax=Coccomyxa subellipsoidea (strain C-169) TaxID=574566 RepID=I0YN99_COCSC|nr:DEAD-domain-containing protein [Coccomyxa subellipsoidea C-169]EIE19868.1 DEAD-domain-containing protein [Coccomyxa subellipsoidea C-169]|eukprot:XP_005644412.1 DEAD-domain-containing protein [Coccomyxa subellipsoidea C-169]
MSQDGLEDTTGITLFAKQTKKRRRKEKETGDAAQKPPPETENDSKSVEQNTAALGAETAANDEATERQEPASTSGQEAPVTFRSLGISEWLDRVCKSLGMVRPTQVQRGCIPAILGGRDVLGTAHTGSGKTAAFALPILQRLAREPYGIFALVLTPTRELAMQLADQFRALGSGMSLTDAVVIGGLDMQSQAKALAQRPHIIVATPGRLRDLLSAHADLAEGFNRVAFLVLDEADRLLEPTFESELRVIASHLPAQRQTLLFSATLTRSLATLQASALRDAFLFQADAYEGLETAVNLREDYLFIPAKVRELYLVHVLESLEEFSIRSAIVFCSTCRGCHLLSLLLAELGVASVALHSHLTQGRRLAALHRFKSGGVPILLATDVASRGLDIPTVDLVVNYELPSLPRDYVHRVGRTARAGRGGWALSLVTQYDVELVQHIESLIGHQLREFTLDEAQVLKGITRVYSAKRSVAVKALEDESRDDKHRQLIRRKSGPKKAKKVKGGTD